MPKSASNEREVPRPNTAPFSLCLLHPQAPPILPHLPSWIRSVAVHFFTHKITLCIVCIAKFAIFRWIRCAMRAVCCAYLDKFVMLNFVAVPLKFATLCRFVAKLATPPPCVLRFAEFSAPCHAPLRHKSTLCHAIPHAKFSPQTQGASTATLKGTALRWHKAFA